MSEQPQPTRLPSVNAWRGDFLAAARTWTEQHPPPSRWRRLLRRWLLPFVVVVAIASGSFATAKFVQFIDTDGEVPPFRGETHGFVNLKTGLPIECPDGSLLTDTPPYGMPRCPDGSIPRLYRVQLHALLRWGERDHPEAPLHYLGPRFEYELDEDGNPVRPAPAGG
jgi:hypothetical protein